VCLFKQHKTRDLTVNVPSEVGKCAVLPDNLRSEISFKRTCTIPNLSIVYLSHSHFNAWRASMVVCLHGCTIACAL